MTEKLIVARLVAMGLEHLLEADKNCNQGRPALPSQSSHLLQFFSETVPRITVAEYCDRLEKYLKCSPECMIIALAYLRRYLASRESRPQLYIHFNAHTVHRLFALSCVVAAKMRDDIYFGMSYYCQVVGITHKKLLDMEITFFGALLDFDAGCTRDEYLRTLDWLQTCAPVDVHATLEQNGVHSDASAKSFSKSGSLSIIANSKRPTS